MFLALHIPTEWSFLSYEVRSGPIGNLTLRWLRPFTWYGSRTNFYLKDNYTYPLCKKTNVEGYFFFKKKGAWNYDVNNGSVHVRHNIWAETHTFYGVNAGVVLLSCFRPLWQWCNWDLKPEAAQRCQHNGKRLRHTNEISNTIWQPM